MPVPRFAKCDHSEPCTSAADEDAVVLLYDAVVVCKHEEAAVSPSEKVLCMYLELCWLIV